MTVLIKFWPSDSIFRISYVRNNNGWRILTRWSSGSRFLMSLRVRTLRGRHLIWKERKIPLIEENQRKGDFEQSSDAFDSRLRVFVLRKFGIEPIKSER